MVNRLFAAKFELFSAILQQLVAGAEGSGEAKRS